MEIVAVNQISPDQVILWSWGFITINVTIIYTWLVMAILVGGSWLIWAIPPNTNSVTFLTGIELRKAT